MKSELLRIGSDRRGPMDEVTSTEVVTTEKVTTEGDIGI